MRFKVLSLLLCAAAAVVAGCGGGGGGAAPSTAVISGVASKGPINGGTVTVFAIDNGVVATTPLATTTTSATGAYSVDIGARTGPVLVRVSGGNYVNEATNATSTPIPLTVPLRAFVPAAAIGGNPVAVTALTEVAAKKIVTGTIDAANIQRLNGETGALFGVADIIATQPVDALTASPGASQAQKEYSLALATVSQYAQDTGKSLDQSMTDLATSDPTPTVLNAISAAITSFVTSPRNQTGVSGNVNATQVTLTLNTQGTLPSGTKIGTLDLTVNLPAGINAPPLLSGAEANQVASTNLQFASAVPIETNRQIFGGFSSAGVGTPGQVKIGVIHVGGLSTGPFATLILPKAAGTALTPLHFSLTGFSAFDTTSGPGAITGLSPSLSASFQ